MPVFKPHNGGFMVKLHENYKERHFQGRFCSFWSKNGIKLHFIQKMPKFKRPGNDLKSIVNLCDRFKKNNVLARFVVSQFYPGTLESHYCSRDRRVLKRMVPFIISQTCFFQQDFYRCCSALVLYKFREAGCLNFPASLAATTLRF